MCGIPGVDIAVPRQAEGRKLAVKVAAGGESILAVLILWHFRGGVGIGDVGLVGGWGC